MGLENIVQAGFAVQAEHVLTLKSKGFPMGPLYGP